MKEPVVIEVILLGIFFMLGIIARAMERIAKALEERNKQTFK